MPCNRKIDVLFVRISSVMFAKTAGLSLTAPSLMPELTLMKVDNYPKTRIFTTKERPPQTRCGGRGNRPLYKRRLLFVLRFGQGLVRAVGLVGPPIRNRRPAKSFLADNSLYRFAGQVLCKRFFRFHNNFLS